MSDKTDNPKNKNLSPIEIYYESIMEKVQKYYGDKEYDKALELLEDELDAPYIPNDYYESFESIRDYILADKKYFSGEKEYEKLSREELILKAFENEKINMMAFSVFEEKFNNIFNDEEILKIKKAFLSPKIDNSSKLYLAVIYLRSNINEPVKYYNNYLKAEYTLDKETKLYEDIDLYKNTMDELYKLAFKEPSLLNYCNVILSLIYNYNFPYVPEFKATELAHGISSYMMISLGMDEKIKKNKIISYIEKIINELNQQII